MKLTSEQIRKIKEQVKNYFKNEDNLINLLSNHEDKFNNIYNEIPGNTPSSRIGNLIDELDNREQLEYFLKIVGITYPSLKKYYILLTLYNKLSFFISILRIFSQKHNEFILDFFSQCIKINKPITIDNIELYLKEEIEKEYPVAKLSHNLAELEKLNSYVCLIDFIEKSHSCLLTSDHLDEQKKGMFKKWIVDHFPDIEINYYNLRISDNTLQSYLLIIIEIVRGITVKTKEVKFNVSAELIENFNEEYVSLPIQKRKTTSVKLELEDKKDGYQKKDLSNIIYKYIDEVINRQDKYLGAKVRIGQPYELKIELFLPKDIFTEDFDFNTPDILKSKNCSICEEYPIVLRSLDRLKNLKWHNSWNLKWNKFMNSPRNFDINRSFQDRSNNETLELYLSNSSKQKQLRNILSEITFLKISCGLPRTKTKIYDLFEIILEAGIPLCLWLKNRSDIDEQNYHVILQQLDRLFADEKLKDLDLLTTDIFELRKNDLAQDNPQNYLGFHLRVMYENLERIPFNINKNGRLT